MSHQHSDHIYGGENLSLKASRCAFERYEIRRQIQLHFSSINLGNGREGLKTKKKKKKKKRKAGKEGQGGEKSHEKIKQTRE